MRRKVLVTLLVTVYRHEQFRVRIAALMIGAMRRTVFRDVVEVVPADDNRTRHLGGDDTASEDAAADGDLTGEGALLIYTASSPFEAERI